MLVRAQPQGHAGAGRGGEDRLPPPPGHHVPKHPRGGLTGLALGGLNYQIEHHLFPSMPRPSLRHAREPVRAFCAEQGIAYRDSGFFASYAQVLRHLHTVGGSLRPELEH